MYESYACPKKTANTTEKKNDHKIISESYYNSQYSQAA